MLNKPGFFTLILLLICISCTNINQGPVEEGKLENGIYTSTHFNLSMNVPESWTVNTLGKVEKKATATETKDTVLVANLLTIYQEIEKEEFKPNLSMIAESSALYPELKNESDYLVHTKNQYANLATTSSDIKKTFLTNDIECHSFNITMTIQEMTMQQIHFAFKRNGYFIDLVVTYQNDIQKEELLKIINSLSFSQ